MVTRTLRVSPRQRNSFGFFLSNAAVIIFFIVTLVLYKRPSYFFLSFIFLRSLKYFIYFFSLVYLSFSDENIFLLLCVYYQVVFMNNNSFMFSLFDSQSDGDAGSDDDGADTPSVVLPAPATPAPLVVPASSVAPPAAPMVAEVNAILSGQYYLIIIVNSNYIQPVVSVCCYRY